MHVEIAALYGFLAGGEVDHVNGCGCDNRKENLRAATHQQNLSNCKKSKNNTSGVIGVSWDLQRGCWKAYITIDGKAKHLGRFGCRDQAIQARRQAEQVYFGEFTHDPTCVCPLGYSGECLDCAARLRGLENAD